MIAMSEDELKKIVDKALKGTPIKEPIIGDITYQINGVDVEPPVHFRVEPITPSQRKYSVSFTVCNFKSYNTARLLDSKPEYSLDTISGTAITPDKYMYSDCRKKKMDTKLKRSLR